MATKPSAKELREALTLMTAARQTGTTLRALLKSVNRFNSAMHANIRLLDRSSEVMEASVEEEDDAEE